jgi:hypothetical protein
MYSVLQSSVLQCIEQGEDKAVLNFRVICLG